MMRRDLLTTLGVGIALTLAVQTAAPLLGSVFADVSDDHPAAAAIERLRDAGILTGDEDGNFRPNDAVTRGELAIALDRIVNGTAPDTNDDENREDRSCDAEPECAPPDEFCFFGNKEIDDNGCVIDCGPLACEGGNAAPPECAEAPVCVAEEGCRYEEPERDENGCEVGCGSLVCDEGSGDDTSSDDTGSGDDTSSDDTGSGDDTSSDDTGSGDDWFEPAPDQNDDDVALCDDEPTCGEPEDGCRYEGDAVIRDERNCAVGCGEIVCDAE